MNIEITNIYATKSDLESFKKNATEWMKKYKKFKKKETTKRLKNSKIEE